MRFFSTLMLSVALSLSWSVQAAQITGEAVLDSSLAGKVAPGDTVFIFARASKGPRMPLALVRGQVKDLPMKFTLEDGQAMMAGMELSKFPVVDVVARVSKSGNAMPSSGDLQGMVKGVAIDSDDVAIIIDQVLP